MGLNIIVSCVEMEKNKEPDWVAAAAALKAMTREELELAACYTLVYEDAIPDCTDVELRKRLEEVLVNIQDGWEGHDTLYACFDGARTRILMSAGRTWGDSVDEVDAIIAFANSPMLKAAGFIIPGEDGTNGS